jgi:class 3 adenylate cyclase
MDPEDWRTVAAAYQHAAADVVERFGGHVAKYLGDGLLVYFGYPQAHEDDAERAARAGLAMVNAVQHFKDPPGVPTSEDAARSSARTLRVRVGIHTGLTVIGEAGDRADVFGDSVNLAARIQSAAAPDTVVISGASLRLIRGIFVIEELGARRLKGFAEPVPLYRVAQPSGVRSRLDLAAGKFTPLVGRQSELGMLLDAWERVLDGTGQTVLVHGEPGVGKSRLVYELRERLGAAPHTWLALRSLPRPGSRRGTRISIGSTASSSSRSVEQPTRPLPVTHMRSIPPASTAPARMSCAPRRASRASGSNRASAPRRAICSAQCTRGSPKASIRATYKKPRPCLRRLREGPLKRLRRRDRRPGHAGFDPCHVCRSR